MFCQKVPGCQYPGAFFVTLFYMGQHTAFNSFPTIQTERLLLKQIEMADAEAIYKMRSNKRVNEFIGRPEMENLESAIELVNRVQDAYKKETSLAWSGILRGEGQCIGTCGFNHFDFPNHHAEIGGELDVNYWGKNIAIEAVEGIIQYGFESLQLHSIEAKVSPLNRGAIFLLETLGFEKEAHFRERVFFRNQYLDMAVYTCFKPSGL
jgi:ribosomal-protein-alanine N-acetyltransferase